MYRVFRYNEVPSYWPAVATVYVDYPNGSVEEYVTDKHGTPKLVGSSGISKPIKDGLNAANSPSTSNPFATIADVSAVSFPYPGAGIPLSTGSGWGTSLANNSANWNTAYSWGNHASAGYALASSLGDYLPLAGGTMTGDALIVWNNGQSIGKGRVDTGLGGYGGISLYCSLGYELNWQAGWLTKWDQAGTNVENILLGSNLQFDASGYLADKAGVSSLGVDERFLYNENAVKMFNWGGTDYLTFYCETQSGTFRLSWPDVTDGRLISLPDEDGTLITDTTLGIILGDYVPYLGATNNVDLGLNNLTAKRISALVEFGLFDTTLNGESSITNDNGIFSYQPVSGLSMFQVGGDALSVTNIVGTKTVLSFAGITAPTKTITVPNANGTMALTSDLSAYAGLATANAFTPPSLTGSQATSALSIVQTYNTTGSPTMLYLNALHTASGASTLLADFRYASVTQFSVSKAGAVYVGGVLSTNSQVSIAQASDIRWNNRSRMYSDASGTIRLMNSALTDFDRLQYGGSTATFPAHKRVNATIETRLADDSGYAAAQTLYERFGSGSPEGVVTAPVGAIYHRTNGSAGTSNYFKESGTGNTGWVAK